MLQDTMLRLFCSVLFFLVCSLLSLVCAICAVLFGYVDYSILSLSYLLLVQLIYDLDALTLSMHAALLQNSNKAL
jgi:hypothetical protein